MTRLDGTQAVLDFVARLPPKQAAQILKKVLSLGVEPRPSDSRKLVGYDYFRVSVGEYRIIYEYIEDTDLVQIILVDNRNDNEVYKVLKRRG